VFQTRLICGIQRDKFPKRDAGLFFLLFHAPNIHPRAYLCQGDNSVILRGRLGVPSDEFAASVYWNRPVPELYVILAVLVVWTCEPMV
jgi:hypothetical protein